MAMELGARADAADEPTAGGLRLRDLLTGDWFSHVVRFYLRYRALRRRGDGDAAAGEDDARGADDTAAQPTARAAILRASALSAAGGAATAAITTGGAWLSAQGPGAALAAIPASALAIVAEMLGRAVLDVRLVYDLADRAGVPFDDREPGDVSRLVALAHGSVHGRDPQSLGRSLVERLLGGDDADPGRSAGNRRFGEGIAKNLVPVLNVATSAIASWHRTRQLGDAAWRYVRFRRAASTLERSAADAQLRDLLIEAAWVLFTADGPLDAAEASSLVRSLRDVEPGRRDRVTARFSEGTAQFLDRLRNVPESSRAAVWSALQRLAAADGSISPADRTVLDAAATALGEHVAPERLHGLVDELRRPVARSRRSRRKTGPAGRHDGASARSAAGHDVTPAP